MTSTSLGYSQASIAGFLPRSELGNRALTYEESLTSYPVDHKKSPLVIANEGYYSKTNFGKKGGTVRTRMGLKQIKKMISTLKSI